MMIIIIIITIIGVLRLEHMLSNVSKCDVILLYVKPYGLSHLQYAARLARSYVRNISFPSKTTSYVSML
jgi:hypothetical protein